MSNNQRKILKKAAMAVLGPGFHVAFINVKGTLFGSDDDTALFILLHNHDAIDKHSSRIALDSCFALHFGVFKDLSVQPT